MGGGREGEERKWEAREFKTVFVYCLTLGCSKGKWHWACLVFPTGLAPPEENLLCTWVLRGRYGAL